MSEPSESRQGSHQEWTFVWRARPVNIVLPGPGQESVWSYPRPPRVERVEPRIRVELDDRTLADTVQALRVCETASPPAYYIPRGDVEMGLLERSPRRSCCEWKGMAAYWSVRVGDSVVKDAGWSYPTPWPGFEAIRDWIAFHPGRVDACWVGVHRVRPQPGSFYGGWITPNLVGPFKGSPGSEHW
jgi:uncharacterized protein (DUF427 family)